MKTFTGKVLSLFALAGMILPAQAFDQPASVTKAQVTDIALSATGELHGIVVRPDGQPISAEIVRVSHNGKQIAAARSGVDGRYVIKGLRPGTHHVKALNKEQVCRLWQAETAPPAAKKGLITTQASTVVRGQDGGFLELGSSELFGLVLFGGVTAVTLATTLDNDDDPIAPASP